MTTSAPVPNAHMIHRGHIFHIAGNPQIGGAIDALTEYVDGGLAIDVFGTIVWCGNWNERPASLDTAVIINHPDSILLPGFVDCHIHFPQVFSADSFGGGQLLEWLDNCIFPSEAKLAAKDVGEVAARVFCRQLISAGTTTSLVFGSQFPQAQDALHASVDRVGLRMVTGRTTMTIGPDSAKALLTSESAAIALVRSEIETWHPGPAAIGSALQFVAVVPRFALSVTPTTLAALGDVFAEYREAGVYFTSHINENNRPGTGEVDTVKRVFGADSYLDTFDGKFLPGSAVGGESFLGPKTVLAHAVHCQDAELNRMTETGTSIAHCPVSQQFLGSGTLPWRRTVASGVNVAMGTDICAGDEWSIPRVLNCSFKVHISEPGDSGISLHPAELLFSGTLAGARALDLEHRIGNFDPGKEADFVVVDPSRSPLLADALEYRTRPIDPVKNRDAFLFTTLMAMNEISIADTYVRGRRLDR